MRRYILITIFTVVSLGAVYWVLIYEPSPTDEQIIQAITESDDYATHYALFLPAAKYLIEDDGRCEVEDFKKSGGWLKDHDNPGHYYTFCGKYPKGHRYLARVYLRISDGSISTIDPPANLPLTKKEEELIGAPGY